MECRECKRDFPQGLIKPMFTSKGNTQCCPICALEIRNKIHGLNDKKFVGTMANQLLNKARAHIKKGGFTMDKLGRHDYVNKILEPDTSQCKMQDILQREKAIEEIKSAPSFVLITTQRSKNKCTCAISESDKMNIIGGLIKITETLME